MRIALIGRVFGLLAIGARDGLVRAKRQTRGTAEEEEVDFL
jgi:hypothetical protein